MEREAEARIDVIEIRDRIDELRQHIARDTELAVTGGRQRIELAALFSNQDVRARDIRAAGEVETNKRNLAGTEHIDAARTTQRDEVADSAAKAACGSVNRLKTLPPKTDAVPATKPCEMSWRRVIGRG